jgi:hypothetical protein
LPTANRRAPEMEEMAAVVLGVPGNQRAENGNGMGREGSSAALEPEEMMRGGAHGQCHGDSEVAAAELRDSVARAREGQGGEVRAAAELRDGVARSWR